MYGTEIFDINFYQKRLDEWSDPTAEIAIYLYSSKKLHVV